MTAANVITFFAQAHWGSPWGAIDFAHKTHHKGLDCGLFHGNVDVPALYAGEVVAVGPSSSVGHYVTVQRGGLFDTYCHIVPGVSVGQSVAQGARLGRQAVTPAEGGTSWLGQHTHLCLSNTIFGWGIWDNGVHNLDPTPGVIAALTSTAGSGGSVINDSEDEDMGNYRLYRRTDAGVTTYALGVLDPDWRTPGKNFWWEGPATAWRDVLELFGPATEISNDSWNTRSNDPHRIADWTKFPSLFGSGAAAPVIDYDKLATALAAKLTPPLNAQQITDAASTAVRTVLGSLDAT